MNGCRASYQLAPHSLLSLRLLLASLASWRFVRVFRRWSFVVGRLACIFGDGSGDGAGAEEDERDAAAGVSGAADEVEAPEVG